MTRSSRGLRDDGDPTWSRARKRPLDEHGPGGPWIGTGRRDETVPVIDAFVERVLADPGGAALIDGETAVAAEVLMTAALRLAADVHAACDRGGRAAILMGSAPGYATASLACFAAGKLHVALDTRYPEARNAAILADFAPDCVIHDGRSPLPSTPAGTVLIDVAAPRRPGMTATPGGNDEAAFVLYTSGSTGAPKGIVNSQRALLRRVYQEIESLHVGDDDTVACLASPCTIAGMREMYAALLGGAALRMIDPETVGLRETRRLVSMPGTLAYGVPSLMRNLFGTGTGAPGPGPRAIRLGGEKVSWSDVDAIRGGVPPSCLIQIGYSSSETTGSQRFVRADEVRKGANPSIGRLLPGVEYAVVGDDGLRVTGAGTGELIVRGRAVALGTWRDGACRDEGFADDGDGNRTFRTGDVVEVASDGEMTVLGRADRQIKINGRRVEPDEIEAAMRGVDAVADAFVMATREGDLIGFVVAAGPGRDEVAAAARRRLVETLPLAWHPRRLHALTAFPRLPSGKLDRRALEDFDAAAVAATTVLLAPAAVGDRVAAAIAEGWRSALGRAPSGAGFDADGGDSLSMLRLVFEVEERTGLRIDLETLRMDMAPRAMAEAIATRRQDVADARPCVLLLPGLTGDSPSLASLRVDLSTHFRFVVAEYPSWRTMASSENSIAAMSDAVISTALSTIPEGTVRIAGYSLGGAVGHNVACRLDELGRTLEWFVVLDTNVETSARTKRDLRSTAVRIHRLLTVRGLAGRSFAQAAAAGLSSRFAGPVLRMLASGRWIERLPSAARFSLENELCEALQRKAMGVWAKEDGRLRIRGRVHLLRSAEKRMTATPHMGWQRLFEEVSVSHVGGDHHGMLRDPHRKLLVERLLSVLRDDGMARAAQSRRAANGLHTPVSLIQS